MSLLLQVRKQDISSCPMSSGQRFVEISRAVQAMRDSGMAPELVDKIQTRLRFVVSQNRAQQLLTARQPKEMPSKRRLLSLLICVLVLAIGAIGIARLHQQGATGLESVPLIPILHQQRLLQALMQVPCPDRARHASKLE